MSPALDAATSPDWVCPGCGRSKFETVMWYGASRSGSFPEGYRLFLISIARAIVTGAG